MRKELFFTHYALRITPMPYYEQTPYNIRLEWGAQGINALSPTSDVTIVVDVLSFTTCVEIAVSRGATIFPFRGDDPAAYAKEKGALLATKKRTAVSDFTLSPTSLMTIPPDTRLVLPSPNGSLLTMTAAEYGTVLAGCLRNSQAVAAYAAANFEKITVIPCGERWWHNMSLRPSLEDILGAGAIISRLGGSKSPEAIQAEGVYRAFAEMSDPLLNCSSGVELREQGFEQDVLYAAEENVSDCVPIFANDSYQAIDWSNL
ncbi:MAG: 2-phosphosulfolactate phosphatase [Chloroflexota bacterium]